MRKGFRATHCKRGHEFTPENVYINPDGRQSCRVCRQDWMDSHRPAVNSSCKKYYRNNIKKERIRKRRYLYGMDDATYTAKLKSQGGVCAISGLQGLAVDHDHRTNTNRGLLNRKINAALGLFQENPDWLRKAADYIEFWRDYDLRAAREMVLETQER